MNKNGLLKAVDSVGKTFALSLTKGYVAFKELIEKSKAWKEYFYLHSG